MSIIPSTFLIQLSLLLFSLFHSDCDEVPETDISLQSADGSSAKTYYDSLEDAINGALTGDVTITISSPLSDEATNTTLPSSVKYSSGTITITVSDGSESRYKLTILPESTLDSSLTIKYATIEITLEKGAFTSPLTLGSSGVLTIIFSSVTPGRASSEQVNCPIIDAESGVLSLQATMFVLFNLSNAPLLQISAEPSRFSMAGYDYTQDSETTSFPPSFTAIDYCYFVGITRYGGNGTIFSVTLNDTSDLQLTNAHFDNCELVHYGSINGFGGAIYLNVTSGNAKVTFDKLSFTSTIAPSNGSCIFASLPSLPSTATASTAGTCLDSDTWTALIQKSPLYTPCFDDLYVIENRGATTHTATRDTLSNVYELLNHVFVGSTYSDTTSPTGSYYYPYKTLSDALTKTTTDCIFILYGDTVSETVAAHSITRALTIAGVGPSIEDTYRSTVQFTQAATTFTLSKTLTLCRVILNGTGVTFTTSLFDVKQGGGINLYGAVISTFSSSKPLIDFDSNTAFTFTGETFIYATIPLPYGGEEEEPTEVTSSIESITCTSSTLGGSVLSGKINSDLSISGITFKSCTSQQSGGAINLELVSNSTLTLDTLSFSACTSAATPTESESAIGGGAVYIKLDAAATRNTLKITHTSFDNQCQAADSAYGGALFIYINGTTPSLSFDSLTFSGSWTSTNAKSGYCMFVYIDDPIWVTSDKIDIWNQFASTLIVDESTGDNSPPEYTTDNCYMINYCPSTTLVDLYDLPLPSLKSSIFIYYNADDSTTASCQTTTSVYSDYSIIQCPTISAAMKYKEPDSQSTVYDSLSSPVFFFKSAPQNAETEQITLSGKTLVTFIDPLHSITSDSVWGNLYEINVQTISDDGKALFVVSSTLTIQALTFSSVAASDTITSLDNILFSVSNSATLTLNQVMISGTGASLTQTALQMDAGCSLVVDACFFSYVTLTDHSLFTLTNLAAVTLTATRFNHIICNSSVTGVNGGAIDVTQSSGTFTLDGCTFDSCSITGGNGGALSLTINGGTVSIATTNDVTFTTCTATKNETGIRAPEEIGGSGGAMYITIKGGTLNLGGTTPKTQEEEEDEEEEEEEEEYPTVTFDRCSSDTEVGFGGSYFISHSGTSIDSTAVNFGHHLFNYPSIYQTPIDNITGQGTFVYFISSVAEYVTTADRFRDLLRNTKIYNLSQSAFVYDDYTALDAFIAYDASDSSNLIRYQMAEIGGLYTYASQVSSYYPSDVTFCGVQHPCATVQGANENIGRFVNKPSAIHLEPASKGVYFTITQANNLTNDATIEGVYTEDYSTEAEMSKQKQIIQVSITSQGRIFNVSAQITFTNFSVELESVGAGSFFAVVESGGALQVEHCEFISDTTLGASSLFYTSDVISITDTVFSLAGTASSEAYVIYGVADIDYTASLESDPVISDTPITLDASTFELTDVQSPISIQTDHHNVAVTGCNFIDTVNTDETTTEITQPSLSIELWYGTVTLSNTNFTGALCAGQPSSVSRAALSVTVRGNASITHCHFTGYTCSVSPLSLSVEYGSLEVSNCEITSCFSSHTSTSIGVFSIHLQGDVPKLLFSQNIFTIPPPDDDDESTTPRNCHSAVVITLFPDTNCSDISLTGNKFTADKISAQNYTIFLDDLTQNTVDTLTVSGNTFTRADSSTPSYGAIELSVSPTVLNFINNNFTGHATSTYVAYISSSSTTVPTEITVKDCIFTSSYNSKSDSSTLYLNVFPSKIDVINNQFTITPTSQEDEDNTPSSAESSEQVEYPDETGSAIYLAIAESCTSGDITFTDNTFTHYRTTAQSAAIYASYDSLTVNLTALSFINNTFDHCYSKSGNAGVVYSYLSAETFNFTRCTFTNSYGSNLPTVRVYGSFENVTVTDNTFTIDADTLEEDGEYGFPLQIILSGQSNVLEFSSNTFKNYITNGSVPGMSIDTPFSVESLTLYNNTFENLIGHTSSSACFGALNLSFSKPVATASITEQTFTNCTTNASSSNYRRSAASIYFSSVDQLTLSQCIFTNSFGLGGYSLYIDAKMTEFSFDHNVFSLTSDVFSDETNYGSAVFISETLQSASLEITDNVFENSIPEKYYGGIYLTTSAEVVKCSGNTYTNCSSNAQGAALYISDSSSSSNISLIGESFASCSSNAQGGAVYISVSSTTSDSLGVVTFSNYTFTSCTSNSTGGAVYLTVDTYRSEVSFAPADATADISASFDQCTAKFGGGAIHFSIENAYPYSTTLLEGVTFNKCTSSAFNSVGGAVSATLSCNHMFVTDCVFTDCTAFVAGAIYGFLYYSSFQVSSSSFSHCNASRIGGACHFRLCNDETYTSAEDGEIWEQIPDFLGSIHPDTASDPIQPELLIYNATFTDCHVLLHSSGGALCVGVVDGRVNITSSTVTGCSSTYSGGGVYLVVEENATATISTTVIESCNATHNGGGALFGLNGGILKLAGVQFKSCKTGGSGGGAYLGMTSGSFSVVKFLSRSENVSSSFTDCSAGYEFETTSDDAEARRNEADGCGGAMYLQLNVPEDEKSSTEELDGDKFAFVFEDVQFNNSDALNGKSVYVTTNDPSILNRTTWSKLLPSSASASDFTLSIVNQTEEAKDVSLSEWVQSASTTNSTTDRSTQSSASGGSSSDDGVSAGETALIVLLVIVLIILICLFVFFLLCCIPCSPCYYKKEKEEEDKSGEAGGEFTSSSSSTEMQESTEQYPNEIEMQETAIHPPLQTQSNQSTSQPPKEEEQPEEEAPAEEQEEEAKTSPAPQDEQQPAQPEDQPYTQTAYPDDTTSPSDNAEGEQGDIGDDNI